MLEIIPVIFWLLEGKDVVEDILWKVGVLFYILLIVTDESQDKGEWK